MREMPLSEVVPLWRTLREEGTTVLVTPAMDYVGGLELGGLDVRYQPEEAVAGSGEALRSFLSALDDSVNLLFLFRVSESGEQDIRAYQKQSSVADSPRLREYVASRLEWLRAQRVRRPRLFLLFSCAGAVRSSLARGNLGMRLIFSKAGKLSAEAHARRVKELAALRDRLVSRLGQIGIQSRELSVEEVQRLHYEALNPTASGSRPEGPSVRLRDNVWSEAFLRKGHEALREHTEAEQLAHEDLEDARGYFRQGGVYRRACTLKVLPEGGTEYFSARSLQALSARGPDGADVPFGYSLAVAVHVEPQGFTRWKLNTQHKLVDALRNALPFLQSRDVSQDVEDGARQHSIRALFQELNEMATKVVTLSVTLLLEAPSLEELDRRTEVARAAFSRAGNSELMVEDVAQVPAFLSTLPGSGPYQLRRKGCTSRNAADFLPVFLPWCGGNKASSLLLTPTGEFFRFGLWDKSVGPNAFHGLVCADTGSGKSFTMGALVLDSLASGLDAILVDNGRRWEPLTTLMGGTHLSVDLNTSICPFGPYAAVADASGELDAEAVKQVVRFIEVCVTDHKLPTFDLLQQDVVGRAVMRCYREKFRARPGERPLMGDFRDSLQVMADASAARHDRDVASELCLRLRMFCDENGLYSKFLNRPSQLRYDARLLTFELEKVSKDPLTKRIAMAAIMEAVGNRAVARRARTLFCVDEAHEFLGNDPSVESFLAGCYAKMRKYDVACWTISQKFETFQTSRVAPVIIGNSSLKLFLSHSSGHNVIGRYFGMPSRAVAEFGRLQKRNGHFSDAFLWYGPRMATVRIAVHPLAYWILTTDGDDRALLERAAAKNPTMDRFALLKELAARYPHGARSALNALAA